MRRRTPGFGFVLCVLGVQLASATRAGDSDAQVLRRASTTELVASLPPLGRELSPRAGGRTAAWAPAVSELAARIDRGDLLTHDEWRAALLRSGALRARTRWPRGEPFVVSMAIPSWLTLAVGQVEIRCAPRVPGWKVACVGHRVHAPCGLWVDARAAEARYQVLGALSDDTRVVFDVEIERASGGLPSAHAPRDTCSVVWSGTLAFDVDVAPTIDDVVEPIASAELDRAVRESLSLVAGDLGGRRTALLVLDAGGSRASIPRGVGVSLAIDVLRNSVVVETTSLLASAHDDPMPAGFARVATERVCDHRPLRSIAAGFQAQASAYRDWSVRVTGVATRAHELFHVERRYAGSFVVPVEELVMRGTHGRNSTACSGPR